MSTAPKGRKSLYGTKLQVSEKGNLVGEAGVKDVTNSFRVNHTMPGVVLTGTISAEGATVANQRDISLQLKDINGDNINTVEMVEIYALLNAAGTDFAATGGSTGIAAGATGKLLTTVAKKAFIGLTSATGAIAFSYTDTGTESVYLGVRLGNGNLVVAGQLTCA